jgi:pyrophosphatase PpaX
MPELRWPVVLFDLDGTLADTIPLILASHDVATREVLGRSFSEAERLSWIGRTLWDIYEEIAPDLVDEVASAYIDWNMRHMHLIDHFPGVNELVTGMREMDVQMGVVTSKRRPAAQATLDAVDLGWVPLLATAFETPEHKPSPLPLLHGLKAIGADVSDAVYVGDAVVDVEAAQAAGMAAVAVTWGAGRPEELSSAGPEALVRDAGELREVLLGF